jgi:hypothetical protein
MTEEIIDEKNFKDHFKDVRNNAIQKGEIMAKYTSYAEFVDGNEKKQILYLVKNTDKMHATSQVMRKLLFASELDAFRVPREMAEDLANGMSEEEVLNKPYKYKLEMFFYTKSENVPKDDPHWSIISIINAEDFVKSLESDKNVAVNAKILSEEENKKLNEELKKEEKEN